MKKNKGVSMITLIITIIVIIILAAIAFVGMDDATGSAQYAKFSSEFGDYSTNFTSGAVTKIQESLGLAGKVTNKAQIVYCAARGVNLSEFDKVLNGVVIPGGYTSTRFQEDIKDATGATYVLADANTPCYEIKDDVMNEYKGKSFYGNSNGQETHWITATGRVFTLPGYPRTVDGEERMYISADLYYVPKNGDMILASELKEIEPIKIGDETSGAMVGNQQVIDAADHTGNIEVLAKIKVGDYIEYKPNEAEVTANYAALTGINYTLGTLPTSWRVWAIENSKIIIMPTSLVGNLTLGEENNVEKSFEDYKNSETIINNVCKIYTNKALGVTENSIRSLTIEDIEKVSNLATEKRKYVAPGATYGDIVSYTNGNYFAVQYDGSKNKMLDTLKSATSLEPISVQHTMYTTSHINLKWENLSISDKTYGMLLGDYYGWLASPCVYCNLNSVGFDVQMVSAGFVGSAFLLGATTGGHSIGDYGVRPLVTLSASSLLGEGSTDSFATWTIKN